MLERETVLKALAGLGLFGLLMALIVWLIKRD